METDRSTKALEFFKDWSNYLLVTTVAALGWVSGTAESGKTAWVHDVYKPLCIWALALSIIFGIFTLALIPLVQEQRGPTEHNHEVKAKFWLTKIFAAKENKKAGMQMILVCMPQHVLFIAGIVAYALGTSDLSKIF